MNDFENIRTKLEQLADKLGSKQGRPILGLSDSMDEIEYDISLIEDPKLSALLWVLENITSELESHLEMRQIPEEKLQLVEAKDRDLAVLIAALIRAVLNTGKFDQAFPEAIKALFQFYRSTGFENC